MHSISITRRLVALVLAGLAVSAIALAHAPASRASGPTVWWQTHPFEPLGKNGLPVASRWNRVPVCPVSFAHPLCGPWHLPVDTRNPELYGTCSYLVAELRPDLEAVTMRAGGYTDGILSMLSAARRAGYPVTHRPHAADAVIWHPGQSYRLLNETTWTTGAANGHVAYVEGVLGNGDFIISEMNAAFGSTGGDTQILPASLARSVWFVGLKRH